MDALRATAGLAADICAAEPVRRALWNYRDDLIRRGATEDIADVCVLGAKMFLRQAAVQPLLNRAALQQTS